jgi:hypothetical protein
MIIHHGNGNYKRYASSCGNRADLSDSTDTTKVNCIKCIEQLLKNQNFRTKKTELWERRLQELKLSSSVP